MNILKTIFDTLIGIVAGFIALSVVIILFDVCLKAITDYSLIQNVLHPFFRGLFAK